MCKNYIWKNNVPTLIQKYLIVKNANHCLSLQRVITFLLVEGLASVLMATDSLEWWLLKAEVAVAIS